MVGRIYDPRLSVLGINFILVINLLPLLFFLSNVLRKRTINKNFAVFLIAVLLVVTYSIFLFNFYGINDAENYSMNKMIYFFTVFVPLIYYKHEKGLDQYFINSLFLACSIFFLIGLSKINTSPDRMAIFGGGPIVFARWIGIFLIISLHFFKNIFLRIILVSICFLLIIKTGSKGPFIFLIIAFSYSLIKKIRFLRLIPIIIIVSSTIHLLKDFILELLGPRLLSLFSLELLETTSGAGRINRWRLAIEVFLNNPSGVGLGNYVPVSKLIEPNDLLISEYPHNLFLELMSELGFLGVFLSLIIIIKIIKNIKNISLPIYQKQIIIFTMLNTMVSGDIMDARFLFLFIL
jgi:O-antigen ligase